MEQHTVGATAPRTSSAPAPTVAVFATGRCRLVIDQIAHDGLQAVPVANENELLAIVATGQADVVIIEVTPRCPERLHLLPWLVHASSVVVIGGRAGRAGEEARVDALRLGADDAVPEKVGSLELLCRIRALLRRSGSHAERIIVGDLEIDGARWEARLRGERVDLTPMEFLLLQTLARKPDQTHAREQLLTTVWQWPDPESARTRTLDLHASRLRQKLSRDGDEFVVAVRGVGYRLLP